MDEMVAQVPAAVGDHARGILHDEAKESQVCRGGGDGGEVTVQAQEETPEHEVARDRAGGVRLGTEDFLQRLLGGDTRPLEPLSAGERALAKSFDVPGLVEDLRGQVTL